jgi:hypothetical protein
MEEGQEAKSKEGKTPKKSKTLPNRISPGKWCLRPSNSGESLECDKENFRQPLITALLSTIAHDNFSNLTKTCRFGWERHLFPVISSANVSDLMENCSRNLS